MASKRGSKAPPEGSASGAPGEPTGAAAQGIGGQLAQLALWKKAVLALSVLLMGAGVALPFVVGAPKTPPASVASDPMAPNTDPMVQGLAPTEPGGTPPAQETPEIATESEQVLAPTIFRLGFGFFVGFAIAFALRAFVKATLILSGVFLLLLFGLEYAGLISVQWASIENRYDSFSAWLSAEMSSFRAFVSGRVPAAGAALAGLGIGFTRK